VLNERGFYDRISGVYDLIADASEGACRDRGLRMPVSSHRQRLFRFVQRSGRLPEVLTIVTEVILFRRMAGKHTGLTRAALWALDGTQRFRLSSDHYCTRCSSATGAAERRPVIMRASFLEETSLDEGRGQSRRTPSEVVAVRKACTLTVHLPLAGTNATGGFVKAMTNVHRIERHGRGAANRYRSTSC
jgi:hypothetical protein